MKCPRSASGPPLPVSHASSCFLPCHSFLVLPGHGCGDRAYPKSFQLMFALSGRGGVTWAALIHHRGKQCPGGFALDSLCWCHGRQLAFLKRARTSVPFPNNSYRHHRSSPQSCRQQTDFKCNLDLLWIQLIFRNLAFLFLSFCFNVVKSKLFFFYSSESVT